MKKIVKILTPRPLLDFIKKGLQVRKFAVLVIRDALRFYKYAGVFHGGKTESSLASLIAIDYHRLEKGLSLSAPRKGFGVKAAGDLQKNLKIFITNYGVKPICLEAISALDEYYSFNAEFVEKEIPLHTEYLEVRRSIEARETCEMSSIAGTITTSRVEVMDAIGDFNYERFFTHRHSVRSFSGDQIGNYMIDKAVSIAQNAPSVCNRQPWKVYCIQDQERMKELLAIHGGARGFENSPGKLLVVSVELGAFHYVGERNEYWVDGGIFTMSLLNALHAVGLGACCLNWCVELKRDTILREELQIPSSEVVIVLVAVGHYLEEFKVTVSPTKDISEVLIYK